MVLVYVGLVLVYVELALVYVELAPEGMGIKLLFKGRVEVPEVLV